MPGVCLSGLKPVPVPAPAARAAPARADTAPTPALPRGKGWGAAHKCRRPPCGQPRLATRHNAARQTRCRACNDENCPPSPSWPPVRCHHRPPLRPSRRKHENWRSRRHTPCRQNPQTYEQKQVMNTCKFFSSAAPTSSPRRHTPSHSPHQSTADLLAPAPYTAGIDKNQG